MSSFKKDIAAIEEYVFTCFGVPKKLLENKKNELEKQLNFFITFNNTFMGIDLAQGKDKTVYYNGNPNG